MRTRLTLTAAALLLSACTTPDTYHLVNLLPILGNPTAPLELTISAEPGANPAYAAEFDLSNVPYGDTLDTRLKTADVSMYYDLTPNTTVEQVIMRVYISPDPALEQRIDEVGVLWGEARLEQLAAGATISGHYLLEGSDAPDALEIVRGGAFSMGLTIDLLAPDGVHIKRLSLPTAELDVGMFTLTLVIATSP